MYDVFSACIEWRTSVMSLTRHLNTDKSLGLVKHYNTKSKRKICYSALCQLHVHIRCVYSNNLRLKTIQCYIMSLKESFSLSEETIQISSNQVLSIHFQGAIIWASSRENLSSGFATRRDTNRPAQPQKLARVFKFRLQQVEVLNYPGSEQHRRWSDCADVQAYLRLCYSHMSLTGFLMTWLISLLLII